MADGSVLFEVIATDKGTLKIVAGGVENLGKKVDKTAASTKKAGKEGDQYNKKQKSIYQTNLSSAKSFSKMNQTIGGSSGSGALVSTYALLAANVFAATAAFNTLKNAAAVDKLTEGLRAFSNQTGQSLDLVSKRLKEVTGNAISMEQAMRTAALATSAGFGVAEMEGLTRVAKGASLALGRDMGDAIDRLTRGAIKLEPEILDELGIMVRLDDAVETYAAQLGKAASGLTRFERQQAFMNAIITEGEAKFGGIADALQPNAYDNLSAAFADLSKNLLTLLNQVLIPVINFFVKSPGLFLGAVFTLSSGITKRLLPAIGDISLGAKKAAMAAIETSQAYLNAGSEAAKSFRSVVVPVKENAKAFNELVPKIKEGTVTSKELNTASRSLGQTIGREIKGFKDLDDAIANTTGKRKKELIALKEAKAGVVALQEARVSAGAERALGIAQANLRFAEAEIDILGEAQRETYGYRDSLTQLKNVTVGVGSATKAYFFDLLAVEGITLKNAFTTKIFKTALVTLKTAFKGAGLSAKAFGTLLISAIPFIGTIIISVQLLIDLLTWVAKKFGFFSEESKLAKEEQKNLDTVISGIPDKMAEIAKIQERATASTKVMVQEYKILGGLAKSLSDQALTTQKALENAGEGVTGTDATKLFNALQGTGGTFFGKGTSGGQVGQVERRISEIDAYAKSIIEFTKENEKAAEIVSNKLGKSFGEFATEALKGGTSVKTLGDISKDVLADLEVQLNGIAQSAEGLSSSLKEAEKEAGNFLRSFNQKSQYDAIIESFKSITTEIKGIEQQAKEAGLNANLFIGEALKDLGSNVTLLGGTELGKEVQKINLQARGIELARRELQQETDVERRKQLEKQIEQLEKQLKVSETLAANLIKEELPARLALLTAAREAEIADKKQIQFLKARATAAKEIAKDGRVAIAARQLSINILKIEEKQLKRQIEIGSEAVRQAEEKIAAGERTLELEQSLQDALTFKAGAEERLLQIKEEAIKLAVKEEEKLLEEIKVRQTLYNQTKDLFALQISNAEKLNKINKFRIGENLDTTAQEAKETYELAQQRLLFAQQEAELKFAVIEAEYNLLAARTKVEMDINSARIQSLEKETKERLSMGQESITVNNPNFIGGTRTITGKVATGIQGLRDEIAKNLKEAIDAGFTGSYVEGLKNALAQVDKQISEAYSETSNLKGLNEALANNLTTAGEGLAIQREIFAQSMDQLRLDLIVASQDFSKNLGKDLLSQAGGGLGLTEAMATIAKGSVQRAIDKLETDLASSIASGDTDEQERLQKLIDTLETKVPSATERAAEAFMMMANVFDSIFGEDGALVSGMSRFMGTLTLSIGEIAGGFKNMAYDLDDNGIVSKGEKIAGTLQSIANITAGMTALIASYGQEKIKAVDKEIEAEKKRDGKSKESLARIKALEAKKTAIAKKNFELNKKMQIATAIISTAAAVAGILAQSSYLGAAAIPLAVLVGAMGLAQVALIKKQQFQGDSGGEGEAKPTNLTIGGRSSAVDVAKGATSGELNYLRGGRTTGENLGGAGASFPGGAMGRRGYANGTDGIIVGENGPEVAVMPNNTSIIPNYALGGQATNVNFTINAVDGQSVQNMLYTQRGNIIGMIREAANENGEGFLETVDPAVYGGGG